MLLGFFRRLNSIKSLAPGRCGSHFKSEIFKLVLLRDILSTSCEIDEPNLVQVMVWCRQAITGADVDPELCCHMAPLGHKCYIATRNNVTLVITGSSNGLSPVWHEVIIWANLLISKEQNSVKFASKYKNFQTSNSCGNIICKISGT